MQTGSNLVWKTAFTETFQSQAPSCTLDTHLWTLTEVIKRIMKLDCGNKRGTKAPKYIYVPSDNCQYSLCFLEGFFFFCWY